MNAPLSKEQIALLMSDNMTARNLSLPGTDGTVAVPRRGVLARLSGAFQAWLDRRTVIAELRGLSDRELTDIGLVRSDLVRVFDPAYARGREEALYRAASA